MKHAKHRKACDLCQARTKNAPCAKRGEKVQPVPCAVNIQPLPSPRKHATDFKHEKACNRSQLLQSVGKYNRCQRGKKCDLRQARKNVQPMTSARENAPVPISIAGKLRARRAFPIQRASPVCTGRKDKAHILTNQKGDRMQNFTSA